jgi:hypothetical protein
MWVDQKGYTTATRKAEGRKSIKEGLCGKRKRKRYARKERKE